MIRKKESTSKEHNNFVLTIAGSDSSSGAGIQADLKTFYKLKVPALSVITAITAQNSRGVFSIHPIPPKEIEKQIKALEEDFEIIGAKVGMVADNQSIKVISDFFKRRRDIFFLLDPVLISTSGSKLYLEDTKNSLKEKLIPLCNLITPNLDEAKALIDFNSKDNLEIAKRFYDKFNVPILLKGGHSKRKIIEDIFFDGKEIKEYKWKKLKGEFHGTGCILSSAILANIALGLDLKEAIGCALNFLHKQLNNNFFISKSTLKYLLLK